MQDSISVDRKEVLLAGVMGPGMLRRPRVRNCRKPRGQGGSLWPAARKEQDLQSSNHREVNSANNLQELRGGFFPGQATR